MNKKLIIIILAVVLIISLLYLKMNGPVTKMTGVVIKVEDKEIIVFDITKGLNRLSYSDTYHVDFSKEGNIGFKQGQEVEIYYSDKIIDETGLHDIEKIKITKEKSNVEIPKKVLRHYYSSFNNVDVRIAELTSSGMCVIITDTNELKYDYSHDYRISKNVKNENYTGVGYKIGEDTEHSTAPYIRTRFGI